MDAHNKASRSQQASIDNKEARCTFKGFATNLVLFSTQVEYQPRHDPLGVVVRLKRLNESGLHGY